MSSVGKKVTGQKNQGSVSEKASSRMAGDSDEDSDGDMERNFALLSKKAAAGGVEEVEEPLSEGEEPGSEGEDSSDGEDVDEEEAGSDSDDEEDDDDEEDGLDNDDEVEDDEDDEEEVEGEGSEATDATDHYNSGSLQTEEDIKKELSTMSFEDIMKLQNQVGTKVYNKIAYGTTKATQANAKRKRLNKNRPMEISSKRPAPFLRQVVSFKKTVLRDPRFDDLSGEYKPEIFEKTYKFISDIKQREKEIVQKKLKKTKNGNVNKEKLEFLLKRMENQERAAKSREQQREKELEFKRKQREMAGQGLKPFFLKKSDKKKLQLADKYDTLKKSGKLESFLSKKRKRNATKDRRKLPYQQHSQAQ